LQRLVKPKRVPVTISQLSLIQMFNGILLLDAMFERGGPVCDLHPVSFESALSSDTQVIFLLCCILQVEGLGSKQWPNARHFDERPESIRCRRNLPDALPAFVRDAHRSRRD
jgi:hypothetical protein